MGIAKQSASNGRVIEAHPAKKPIAVTHGNRFPRIQRNHDQTIASPRRSETGWDMTIRDSKWTVGSASISSAPSSAATPSISSTITRKVNPTMAPQTDADQMNGEMLNHTVGV